MMEKPIQVFLAGDSTVSDCPPHEAPMAGWGQVFGQLFTEQVKVRNHAKGGASTNSFVEEGRLRAIAERISQGDYLFIQFGHNDQKPRGTKPYSTYQQYLTLFADTAREKGAQPVFVTSVQRRRFDENGRIEHTLGEYPDAMKALAKELDVPVIDLLTKTKALYEAYGPEESKRLFVWLQPNEHPNYPDGIEDNTHFSEEGAMEVAKLVAEGIEEIGLPLKHHLVSREGKEHV
ncbi:rhamnogalacturonan acetylesterase [Bacillus halotolerans]|uniref:rhamnogalacturonan acetylesterase n=1 Tax=Bacillus TaxID=1386 RepID=UPI000D0182FE|nr:MULTISPECIES: rhamnogalacturonan acetylesterase [Bacillus]MDY7433596.1 rhamnogalacturonan acetylesterase [Bacillus sp. V26]MEC1605386.1 rhamnogalacturonan acetylesterase [Bacillus halotolerans]PRP50433.1 rhamnogalacturonan acetylesterase [Bacillus halotolerans]PRP58839.1 rhamnogalacturonan acetylesterase [Bacillus halotolerans]PRP62705.1 rhamnogalacturonan acetylesterase [Bacillus halotolerans]